jgi:hypothetical protein
MGPSRFVRPCCSSAAVSWFAEAIESGQLKNDSRLVLGGFAHAGDFAAAAVVHWNRASLN